MGDWLHCYSCFLQPGDGTHFNLTSCSHIYCQKCLEKGVCREKCAMCGSTCNVVPLSGRIKKTRNEINIIHQASNDKLKAAERAVEEYAGFKEELTKAREELIQLREENSYLKSIISEKGLGFPSPGMIRSQRASPGRTPTSSKPLSRGPSPVFSQSKLLHVRSGSPMNISDHSISIPRPLGKSPGVKSSDMLQFYHPNMSSMEKTHSQRVSSSAMPSLSQQGYPISHPASLSHSAQLPDVMTTSGILQVRTPSSGGITDLSTGGATTGKSRSWGYPPLTNFFFRTKAYRDKSEASE